MCYTFLCLSPFLFFIDLFLFFIFFLFKNYNSNNVLYFENNNIKIKATVRIAFHIH